MSNQPLKEKYMVYAAPGPAGGEDSTISSLRQLAAADTWARFQRHRQRDVVLGSGLDGFSPLVWPEARSVSSSPREFVEQRASALWEVAERMRLLSQGTRAVTSDTSYYRLTQWLFLMLWEAGLVEQDARLPDAFGSDAKEAKSWQASEPAPWHVVTSSFCDRLLSDIDKSQWSRSERSEQRQLLGRLRGVELTLSVSRPFETEAQELTIFTTQVEAVYGATFVLLDPAHPLLSTLTDEAYVDDIERYKQRLASGAESRVTGVRIGGHALNPANLQRIPLIISPLANTPYSEGVRLGVPGHDRDLFTLARRLRLPIREVIHNDEAKFDVRSRLEEPWLGDGVLTNSGPFSGLSTTAGRDRIITTLGRRSICRRVTRYRLRRMPISELDAWGPPVPIVHCARCGAVGIPVGDLP
ncbi:MAG: class I tRNA ligase family protein, partial [Planctomycetes bacterium]|nr:class I tRNA ligase family protein [Planctomycetota bacterium]